MAAVTSWKERCLRRNRKRVNAQSLGPSTKHLKQDLHTLSSAGAKVSGPHPAGKCGRDD